MIRLSRASSAASALGRDMRWVLAKDVEIVPVAKFPTALRRKILGRRKVRGEKQFVIHRARSRSDPKVVNNAVRTLLQQFRQPVPFLQVVIDSAQASGGDPFTVLRRLNPVVRRFVSSGILVRADRKRDGELREIKPSLSAGAKFARHEIIACLRATIDSEVYLGEAKDGRRCVLKITARRFSTHQARQRAFAQLTREFEVLDQLKGTAACRVAQKGRSGGRTYGVIEWIDGPDVARHAEVLRRMASANPRARGQLLDLVCACLQALSSIHRRGYLHGDIHPGNFIVEGSSVRLIDFGLARRLGTAECRTGFSGVMHFMSPEAATALLAGAHHFEKTVRSEIYSMAALAYQILTGKHYLRPTVSKREGALAIQSSRVRSFASQGVEVWREVESALHTALSKRPGDRFRTVEEFRVALTRAGAEAAPAAIAYSGIPKIIEAEATGRLRRFVADYLADLKSVSYPLLVASQPPPYASVSSGGAGISYALLRAAQHHQDPDALALATDWIDQSTASLGSEGAIYDHKEFTPRRVGSCSLYFSEMGVHLVQALVAGANDAEVMRDEALVRLGKCFKARQKAAAHDMFMGLPGCLVAVSLLIAEGPDRRLLLWGETLAGEILRSAFEPKDKQHAAAPWSHIPSLGFAHGIAGIYFALLQWALVSGAKLPPWIREGVRALIDEGLSTSSGLDWPMWRRGQKQEFMDSLCNGTPGIIMTLARAYEYYRDPLFLEVARTAGQRVVRDRSSYSSLCCGMAGRAYSLLSLARIDSDGPWRGQALACAAGSLAQRTETGCLHGLLKGQAGNLCLAMDLLSVDATPSSPLIEAV